MRAPIAIILLLLATSVAAQSSHSGDDKEMQELLSIVQQETDVATKTRLNSDYVPGTVTVLPSDELDALGIRTAGEALGLVPGMQSVLDQAANDSVIVRGLDFPFNAGNIQVLVDGIPIARPDAGITTAALLMPVEQIDRIEVIRGPGSVVYGDFAFMGLVNIITKKEGTRAAFRYESPSVTRLGALRTSWQAPDATNVYANVARFSSANGIGPSPVTGAADGRTFGIFGVQRGGLSVSAQTIRRDFEPSFAPSSYEEKSWAGEVKYGRQVMPSLHAEAKVDYLSNDIASFVSAFTGDVAKGTATVTWTGFARQSWLASADRSHSTIDHAAQLPVPRPGQPPGSQVPLVANVSRDVTGVTLQDRIDVNDSVSVTAGARYDSYSDLRSRITPRIAAVWRINDHHILKAQYAQGFRPPTFFELYEPVAPGVTPQFPFEVNATSEVNYIYRDSGRTGRLTLFRSNISDLLHPGGVTFVGAARARGIEAEWSQQISPTVKIETNISHATTSDPRAAQAGGPNSVASGWLGNAAFLLRPMPNVVVGARWNYEGDRVAGRGFSLVDFTVTRQDLFINGLALRGGVKNALDQRVTFFVQLPNGPVNSLTFPRRAAWVELSWRR